MSANEGFRRAIVGFAYGSMGLGLILLIASFGLFVGEALGWTTLFPSIVIVQSAGWMVITGLVLSRLAKAQPTKETR